MDVVVNLKAWTVVYAVQYTCIRFLDIQRSFFSCQPGCVSRPIGHSLDRNKLLTADVVKPTNLLKQDAKCIPNLVRVDHLSYHHGRQNYGDPHISQDTRMASQWL